jgi:hypothetical protein
MNWAQVINRTMSMKRPDLVSLKSSPNPTVENPWHSQLEMMRSTRLSNSICFFWISCMSKGKKVKLTFHVVVANYVRTTILNCSKALRLVPIPPKSSSNVIPSLGNVQMISRGSTGLIGSPWLSMFSKLDVLWLRARGLLWTFIKPLVLVEYQ